MPYNPRQLSVVGYANGFTLWHFRSADRAPDLLAPHYFDGGREVLRAGDFIVVNLEATGPDGAPRCDNGILAVARTGAAIELAPVAGAFTAPD